MEEKENTKELVLVERSQIEKESDEKILELDKTVCFDNIAPNSVIVLKIGGSTHHKINMHQAFIRFVQSKNDLFKERHFTVLFLEPGDSLDVLTEADMERAGWEKKEKSLIIKPR